MRPHSIYAEDHCMPLKKSKKALMKIKSTLPVFLIFIFGCSKQIPENIFQLTSLEIKESPKKYFFQIKPIKKENGIVEARIINEWESTFGLMELLDVITEEKDSKSINEYKYDSKSGEIIFIAETNDEFNIEEQYVIEIIQDIDNIFKIILEKTINVDSTLKSPFSQKMEERMLTKNGRVIYFEYQYQGEFDCSKEELISLIRNSAFSKETISKKLRSLLRKRIGNLLEEEIIMKINDNSFNKEIENEFKVECFALAEFQINIK